MVNDVYVLDDCHTFNMSTSVDGRKTVGTMRIDSIKGLIKADDGSIVLNPNHFSKISYNNNAIFSNTHNPCCFHFESTA